LHLLQHGWAAGVHPEDFDRCLSIYAAAFDKRETFHVEYRLRRADGEYRWILDTGSPRYAADGAFAGYIGSGVDIDELKHSQERLLAAQKLESLGVLAGGAVHDFNNFLGCILADADVTMSELDMNSPARGGLERIEAVAVRASQIVRQISTYAGEEQQHFEPVDVSLMVQEMLDLLRVCIPKRVRLNFDFVDSLLLPYANAAQLRQVVMNLVLNAGEAIGDRSGDITVTGKKDRWHANGGANHDALAGAEGVCLQISDTGIGMTAEIRRRIFDPLFSTKFPGRGLGLAAVEGIVRNHGGAIDVSSTPGQGTSFRVFLPVRIPESGPVPQLSAWRPGSILIVEDEETLRSAVAKMLRKKGFSVLEAADGDLAVEMIRDRNHNIALMLLDLTLPGKSSHEVFDELQRTRPGVKVILTSAYGRERVAGSMRSLKRESFIRKPYQLNDLVTVVRHALPSEIPLVHELTQSGGAK
jgi:two-component system cell cycle sensor histidine kinase/response regulator CckA